MTGSDRMFSAAEIREQREHAERRLAAQQQKLDALRKMAEAMDQLEQAELAERELERPDQEQSSIREAETAAHSSIDDQPDEPETESTNVQEPASGRTRERVTRVLVTDAGEYLTPWQVWERAVTEGWAEPTKKGRHAIRASLNRLAASDERVERVERPPTHAFRWTANGNGQQPQTQLALGAGLAHPSHPEE